MRSPAKKSVGGTSAKKASAKKPASAATAVKSPPLSASAKKGGSRKRQATDNLTDDEDETLDDLDLDHDFDEDYDENRFGTPGKAKSRSAPRKPKLASKRDHIFKSPPGLAATSVLPAAVLSPAKANSGSKGRTKGIDSCLKKVCF